MKTLRSIVTNLKPPPFSDIFWPQIPHTNTNGIPCFQENDDEHHGCARAVLGYFATSVPWCECQETQCVNTLHYYLSSTVARYVCTHCWGNNHPRLPRQQ